MNIDERVERLVREAISTGVRRDAAALEDTIRSVPDEDTARLGLELVLHICFAIVHDIHSTPTVSQLRTVAENVCRTETWAALTIDEVESFLTALMEGVPVTDRMPAETVIYVAFVVAASLVSGCRRDDEEWWDHLDRVEAGIEAS